MIVKRWGWRGVLEREKEGRCDCEEVGMEGGIGGGERRQHCCSRVAI